MMKISELYDLGRALFDSIGSLRLRPFESQSIGKGAGGDKTFPVDKQAEDIIMQYLISSGKPMTLISEEIGYKEINGGGTLRVLIDPVDGSKNAINGIPIYSSSIAFVEGEYIADVSLALIVNLLTGDCFTASKGQGAYFNGNPINTQSDDGMYLVAYEAQNPKIDIPKIMPVLSQFRRTRCLGSTALDLAYTAYGSISVFITPAPSRTFDFAAGWLLVKEAGGAVTDLMGNTIENVKIGINRAVPIIASGNKQIHEKTLKILNHS